MGTDSDDVDEAKYDMRLALPKKKKKKKGDDDMGDYGEESESEEEPEIGPKMGIQEENLGDLIQNYAKDKERIYQKAVDLELAEEEEIERKKKIDSYYDRK